MFIASRNAHQHCYQHTPFVISYNYNICTIAAQAANALRRQLAIYRSCLYMCSTAKVAGSAAVLISVRHSGGAHPKVPSGNCEEMLDDALHAAGGNFIRFSASGRQPADRMRINECAVAFLFFAEITCDTQREIERTCFVRRKLVGAEEAVVLNLLRLPALVLSKAVFLSRACVLIVRRATVDVAESVMRHAPVESA